MLDFRYTIRSLIKNPGFTLTVILVLAIGIGANTAMFSIVNGVILRPLPYHEPERLLTFWETTPAQGAWEVSYPNFVDWKNRNQSFETIAAYRNLIVTITGSDEPRRVLATLASSDLFATLGIAQRLGRGFLPDEDRPGAPPAAIISAALWRSDFGGAPDAIGKTITVNGGKFTIVGVTPEGFAFPSNETALWLALGTTADQLRNRAVHVVFPIGRLKQGVTAEQASAELSAIAAGIQREDPAADPQHGVRIIPLHDRIVGDSRTSLLLLLGAVGFVLLIACANVGNLLLNRAAARQKTWAICTALGAGRWRIIRQVFSESLILALAGGAAGLLAAVWSMDLITMTAGDLIPISDRITLDRSVLAFAFGLSVLTGLAFGLTPALFSVRPRAEESSRSRTRNILLTAEVALSLVLLIGAGLMLKSLWMLQRVDPGFNAGNLLTLTVSLPPGRYRATQIPAFWQSLQERIQILPAVRAVSAVNRLPISGGDPLGALSIENRAFDPGNVPSISFRRVLPNYFSMIGIPLIEGRAFAAQDDGRDPRTVIINERMAREFWPASSPIGQRIKVGPPEGEPWLTVVGVVGDVRNVALDTEPAYATYESSAQRPQSAMNIVVRTESDPANVVAMVRSEIRGAEKDATIYNVTTMEQQMAASVALRRVIFRLLEGFAAIALVLATVGLYGCVRYSTVRRTREIGVRIAVGAKPSDIVKLIIADGMKPAIAGVVIGLALAAVVTRWMSSMLFRVMGTDLPVFATIALLLTMVTLIASYVPARRAARIDPILTLKSE